MKLFPKNSERWAIVYVPSLSVIHSDFKSNKEAWTAIYMWIKQHDFISFSRSSNYIVIKQSLLEKCTNVASRHKMLRELLNGI